MSVSEEPLFQGVGDTPFQFYLQRRPGIRNGSASLHSVAAPLVLLGLVESPQRPTDPVRFEDLGETHRRPPPVPLRPAAQVEVLLEKAVATFNTMAEERVQSTPPRQEFRQVDQENNGIAPFTSIFYPFLPPKNIFFNFYRK